MKKVLITVFLVLGLILAAACGKDPVNSDTEPGGSQDTGTSKDSRRETEVEVDTFGNTTNGIYLTSKLEIRDCTLYDFDTSKYDADEYKGFLEEELAEYNAAHSYPDEKGKKVSAIQVEKCTVSKNVLTQILKYYDAADFLEYNKSELQKRGGSLLKAGTWLSPDSALSSMEFVDPSGKTVDISSWTGESKGGSYRYMICDIKAVLYGEGKVVAYSKDAVYTKDLNCINSAGGKKVAIIFK